MIAINVNDNDIFDKMIGNEEEVIIKRKNKTDDPFKNLTTEELKRIIFDNW